MAICVECLEDVEEDLNEEGQCPECAEYFASEEDQQEYEFEEGVRFLEEDDDPDE